MSQYDIGIEIGRINKDYRPGFGLDNAITKEYIEKGWNLKNELKKLNINY